VTEPHASWSVLVCDGLAEPGLAELRRAAQVVLEDRSALGKVDAWIIRGKSRVEASDLAAAAPRLRVIGRAGVGVDNIDLEAARRQGVVVVTAPEAATTAVAELTLGLMLALARQIPPADAALRRGEWPKANLMGTELDGKTLGLVGFGRIGGAVGRRAAALGMRILACDTYLSDDTLRLGGAEPRPLPELLAASDFVSLHLPLTEETRGFFGRAQLAQMKRGSRLICAARGGLIDETALLEALQEGRLAGAALDVFAHEPPGENPLLQHPHVVATPHLGAQTAEAQDRVAVDIVHHVLTALRGEDPPGRVA
jgi:D-3-phosphoglycerate dehydrogenase